MRNRVVELFSKKTILITGGTGFVGKVLIEKLLRCCPSLEKIYVIIRGKKGKSADERLSSILKGPLFDLVKKEQSEDILKKVISIDGDVSSSDLGLSPENRQKLIEEVEIIYHCAATVRFDEPLKHTILLNVRGTKLMLDLAEKCQKLKVFSYISTAYCHEDQEVLYEKFYPPPANPHSVITFCECYLEEAVEKMAPRLRGTSANNYTFSKALAEALVAEKVDRLPVIIVRPSAIVPIWQGPIPGWTDNLNGPTGLLIGAGKGVITTMYAKADIFLDCVPVDMVANALIASIFLFCNFRDRRVYNVAMSEERERMGITAQSVIETGKDIIQNRVAFDTFLWYPNGSLKQSRILHYVHFFLFQLLPAMFVDAILLIIGKKPFLIRVQKKVWKGYQLLEYYANRKWQFDNSISLLCRDQLLNSSEKEMFKFDLKKFDIYDYFVNCIISCRRYIMNEPDENIPTSLKKMKMMRCLDVFCKALIFLGFLYLFYVKFIYTYIG